MSAPAGRLGDIDALDHDRREETRPNSARRSARQTRVEVGITKHEPKKECGQADPEREQRPPRRASRVRAGPSLMRNPVQRETPVAITRPADRDGS